MRQCVFVIGTRAQLVKVAPVLTRAKAAGLRHVVWLTGQHDESIDDLIADFGIESEFVRPDESQERSSILRLFTWLPGTLFACSRYLRSIRTLTSEAPLVVVHGDTLSTLLGALAARFAGGRVVHLESGLSSGRINDPFPEEILRRLTFRLTEVALCPNDDAFAHMQRFRRCDVVHTGENTLLDCVRLALNADSNVGNDAAGHFIASVHRFQNIYSRSRLTNIVDELIGLSGLAPVEFILHPPTELRLKKYGLFDRLDSEPGVNLRPRMPYTAFLGLIAAARAVISDGGSNQEELSYLGTPTILFRDRSERPDGIGENVVLYDADIAPLAEFARSGKLDELRKDSIVHGPAEPSQVTVEKLSALAGNDQVPP